MKRKAPPPRYPAWKADKIRARLNSYRIANAADRNLLPLSAVMERLAVCPATDPAMLGRDRTMNFPQEWLRRFTIGQGGLPFDRVDALRRFLAHEDFLTPAELDDASGEFGEMLILYGYLGSTAPAAQEKLSKLPAPYIVTTRRAYDTEVIRLEFARGGEAGLLLVEEVHLTDNKVVPKSPDFKDVSRKRVRKGYAFLSTRMNLLHVFVRGAVPADRVHYFQVEPFVLPADSLDLLLVRIGIPWRAGESFFAPPRMRGGMLTPENCGVMKFEAAPAPAPPEKRH